MSYIPDGMELLKNFESEMPELSKAFGKLTEAVLSGPSLDCKTKQLIYTAVTSALRNFSGVQYHSNEAIKAGATKEQVIEAITITMPCGGIETCILALTAFLKTQKSNP